MIPDSRYPSRVPSSVDGVRHCPTCKHDVVRVKSISALIPLLGKRCVSFTDGD